MFGTIRRHQTWLWAVIITLTIISFVWYFGPTSKVSNARRGSADYGSINGERITEQEYLDAQREVYLQYFFRSGGNWPDEEAKKKGFDPQREAYYRLLLIHIMNDKERKLGIHLTGESDVVVEAARNMLRSFERPNAKAEDVFVSQVLQPKGLRLDDFANFVAHELGIQELINSVGLSGKLVTPQEAQGLYEREHQELAAEAVFFSASNHLAAITNISEAVTQFYTLRTNSYKIPDRVVVSYVKFPVSNVLAQAEGELTNLTELVETNAARMGTNFFRGAKSLEESKTKIRQELIRSRAFSKVRQKASVFADVLLALDPVRADNLDKLAQTNELTVSLSGPFDLEEGPKELDVGPDFAKAAFSRTPDDPLAGPLEGEDGLYIIAFNKKIPSEIPPLDQIRDRVTADYKYYQAVVLARTAGLEFYRTLTNGLAQGKTFAALCAEAKLNLVELPPFSLSTPKLPEVEDAISLNQFKQLAFSTPPGKVSNFQMTGEGGLILYVKSRLPLDEVKEKADLPGFIARVRQARQNEAFNQWFRKEADKGLRDTPAFRPQTPPGLSPGTAKS